MIVSAPIRVEAGSTRTVIDLDEYGIRYDTAIALRFVGSEYPPVALAWTWDKDESCAELCGVIISESTTLLTYRYLMIQKTGGVAELHVGGREQVFTNDGKRVR